MIYWSPQSSKTTLKYKWVCVYIYIHMAFKYWLYEVIVVVINDIFPTYGLGQNSMVISAFCGRFAGLAPKSWTVWTVGPWRRKPVTTGGTTVTTGHFQVVKMYDSWHIKVFSWCRFCSFEFRVVVCKPYDSQGFVVCKPMHHWMNLFANICTKVQTNRPYQT